MNRSSGSLPVGIPYSRSRLRSESGFSLPLFALLVSVIVIFAALIVDHSKEEIAVQGLQRSADAAALAAAKQLNGRLDGWWDAKKVAALALQKNPIHGATLEQVSALHFTDGHRSYWDTRRGSDLLRDIGSEGTSGPLTVKVERGLYWLEKIEDNKPHYKFISLEGGEDDELLQGRDNGLVGAVPYYLIANAVRVTVSLSHLDTVFGGVIGQSAFTNLRREAIAVIDNSIQQTVAPIGIPLCQLLLNMDPTSVRGDQISDHFQPQNQCTRPTYVTETNAKGDVLNILNSGDSPLHALVDLDRRRDGLTRAESFERPPYAHFKASVPNVCYDNFTGSAHNCKALPLYATLGVPGSSPGEHATATEVVNAFVGGGHAQIGSYFKPLDSIQGLSTNAARAAFADAINGVVDTKPFWKVFLPIPNGTPAPNFPYLRTMHPDPGQPDPQFRPRVGGKDRQYYDRNISMPAPPGFFGNLNQIKFLMWDQSDAPFASGDTQLNFTNPMCHDDGIPHNDLSTAKVKEVYAMVIAPTQRFNSAGELVKYCDFSNVFAGSPQDAVAPIADSKPTVVGFVKVEVFDFNFQDLRTRFPRQAYNLGAGHGVASVSQTASTPVYDGTGAKIGNGILWDGNPWALNLIGDSKSQDVINNTKQYEQDYKSSLDCKDYNEDHPTSQKHCDDNPSFPYDDIDLSGTAWIDCFEFETVEHLWHEAVKLSGKTPSDKGLAIIQTLNEKLEAPILSKPDRHCLPRLKDGMFNRKNPNSYKDLASLNPYYGCGGLRARLDCGTDDTVIPTGKPADSNNPTLVSSSSL
jgi:hypothetical protein